MRVNSRVGEIIYNLRNEKHISQSQLCRGLCSVSALSRYERRERIPPRLVLNALIQRLGGSTEYIVSTVTESEYSYFLWKKNVLQAIIGRDKSSLAKLLNSPVVLRSAGTKALQKQFEYVALSYISEFDNDYSNGIALLNEAIELTIPDFEEGLNSHLLSINEALLIVRLSELYLKNENDNIAQILLNHIISYSEEHYDHNSSVAVFPVAVKMLCSILILQNNVNECKRLCFKAIEMIRSVGIGSNLRELLGYYIHCDKNSEYSAKCQKWLWTLNCVFEEYGYLPKSSPLIFDQEIYLIEEIIREYRAFKGWSQEETSDGLFSTRMLSYQENSNHSLSSKNFYSVRAKLSMDEDYFNSQLDTSDYFALEKFHYAYRAIAISNYDEAVEYLDAAKIRLVYDGEQNASYNNNLIDAISDLILYKKENTGNSQLISASEKVLNCRFDDIFNEKFWKGFISKYKSELLNFIAIALVKTEREKAVYIWEHILYKLEKSTVNLSERYSSSLAVITNLSSCYGVMKKYQQCINMCQKGIKVGLGSNRLTQLGRFIGDLSEALICLGNDKEKYRISFQLAYYLSDLYNVKKSISYYDSFYHHNYSDDYTWYQVANGM